MPGLGGSRGRVCGCLTWLATRLVHGRQAHAPELNHSTLGLDSDRARGDLDTVRVVHQFAVDPDLVARALRQNLHMVPLARRLLRIKQLLDAGNVPCRGVRLHFEEAGLAASDGLALQSQDITRA